jgi:hypothetical protein
MATSLSYAKSPSKIKASCRQCDELAEEMTMWRNEALAASTALEELRRLIPQALAQKRDRPRPQPMVRLWGAITNRI